MSDLTLGTPVMGTDSAIGRLTGLVCHPTTREITHLVVNADDVPGSERLVPINRLADCDDDHLTLAMSRHRFFRLKTLETVRLLPGSVPDDGHHPAVPARGFRDDVRAPRADPQVGSDATAGDQGRGPQRSPPRTRPLVRRRPGLARRHTSNAAAGPSVRAPGRDDPSRRDRGDDGGRHPSACRRRRRRGRSHPPVCPPLIHPQRCGTPARGLEASVTRA
jgi:hypothetical protein